MALRKFIHEFKLISDGKTSYSTEDEAHLHCLLKETIVESQPEDFIEDINKVAFTVLHLHQVVSKFDPKSGPYVQSVELLKKILLALKNERHTFENLPVMPMLTDILLHSTSQVEQHLQLIDDFLFGFTIQTAQPFLERLIQFCINILCTEPDQFEPKIQKLALSVLINLCRNSIALGILEQHINVVDLKKKIPLDTFGILACKMTIIFDEFGNILQETDVKNFLKYATKDLHRIQTFDEKSLKHLVEFIRDASKRKCSKDIFQHFDFCLPIKSALMYLDGNHDGNIGTFVSAIFEIIEIVLTSNNNSLHNLVISITSFAIKRLISVQNCLESLKMLATIFQLEPKISTNNFDQELMQESLRSILFSSDQSSTIMAALFKLLNVLAKNYKVNLIKNQVIERIFAPLTNLKSTTYLHLPMGDITMYLECLAMLSTLLEASILDTNRQIFKEQNVQFLVAMSIRHGNSEQCALALSLMNRFSNRDIAETITTKTNINKFDESQLLFEKNQFSRKGIDLSKEFGTERLKNMFLNFEKASLSGKMNVPCSDLIELYTNENNVLKRKIENLSKKYEEIANEVNDVKAHYLNEQVTSLKWSGLAQSVLRANETLQADNAELIKTNTSLKVKLKAGLEQNIDTTRKFAADQNVAIRKNKEMEGEIQKLHDELKDTEDMRQTILSLMTKRKKPSS